jgi:hypothetical protein
MFTVKKLFASFVMSLVLLAIPETVSAFTLKEHMEEEHMDGAILGDPSDMAGGRRLLINRFLSDKS